MEKFVSYIVTSIVDHPQDVKISMIKDVENGYTKIDLKVHNEDVGKVIGKRGRIIKAIRDLIKIKSTLLKEKYFLSLQEN